MLKSPNRNQKKTQCFVCMCFMIVFLSLNIFYTFDIAMPQLSYSRQKTLTTKKYQLFFWFQVQDLDIDGQFVQ